MNVSLRSDRISRTTERACYIHIGTHKTGTTSIQRFLALNRERFAAAGVALPDAGCDNGPAYISHHQIAYELSGNPNFNPCHGGLVALTEELRASDARVACLSSENFSHLWHNEAALVRLRDGLLQAQWRPKVVCYLRPQASYCASVYAQIVCNDGYRSGFAEYLADILTHGQYVWPPRVPPPFDYRRFLDPFAAVFGRDAIIARRYRPAAPDTELLYGFASELAPGITGWRLPDVRENGSLDFQSALAHLERPRPDVQERVRFAPLTIRNVLQIGSRFRDANTALHRGYGIKLPPFELLDLALASPLRRNVARTRALRKLRAALAQDATRPDLL